MFKRALFAAAMEEVCSLPIANSWTSLEKVSILSAGEFVDCWLKSKFKASILWNTYQTLPEGRDIRDFTIGISFLKNRIKSLLLKRQKIGDEVEWHPQSNFNITDS